MVPELFLQETRSVAVTVATIVNWLATFVVGFVFPYILVSLKHQCYMTVIELTQIDHADYINSI
jgi:hypothetical protein